MHICNQYKHQIVKACILNFKAMAIQLLILIVLITGGFYAGRLLFWFLFLKDAPAYDEQENFHFDYQENR